MSDLVSVVRSLPEALEQPTYKPTYWPSETIEDYDDRLIRWLQDRDVERTAARAVAEGVPIQWCEVHGDWSATHLGDGTMCRWAVKVNSDKTCSIVSRLLVDYPKEETP